MTKIYLDVLDRVRVDGTPDGRKARSATFHRGLLEMGDLLARMAALRMYQRALLGRGTEDIENCLTEIRQIQANIRAKA